MLHQDIKSNNYPKSLRVKKRKEFLFVQQKGAPFYHHAMILRVASNRESDPKLGIVVSKKIGNAVVRNYYKRVFRSIFRENKQYFKNSYSYIFIARKNIKELNYQTIKDVALDLVKGFNG